MNMHVSIDEKSIEDEVQNPISWHIYMRINNNRFRFTVSKKQSTHYSNID